MSSDVRSPVAWWRDPRVIAGAVVAVVVLVVVIGFVLSRGGDEEAAPTTTSTTPPTTAAPTTTTILDTFELPAELVSRFPDGSSAGVAPDAQLDEIEPTDGDVLKVTEDLDGVMFRGEEVEVAADGVTISNSYIVVTSLNSAVWNREGFADTTIENSTIVCEPPDGQDPGAAGVTGVATIVGNDISGCADGIKAGDGAVIEGNYIHDLGFGPDTHNDGIQIQAGENITITGNTIVTFTDDPETKQANAGVFAQSESGPIDNLVVSDNYVDGFGFSLRFNGDDVRNSKMTGNIIGPGAYWGALLVADGAEQAANNNVWRAENETTDGEVIEG
ncbi:MAG: right-handed parallel beta-helix repeat-containing protein [Actinomycetota bacterium]|nr:right-handed parallel beta-helix repeat-containing protein [Actinomycetota bacterium]